MVIINKENCVGCGGCQFVRMALTCIKDDGVWQFYENPKPEDMKYVENAIAECPASSIIIKNN